MNRVEARIRQNFAGLTKTNRQIAEFMLGDLQSLAFENAASIARKVGTTPMTVGRFLRALGYQGIDALHTDLRSGLQADNQPIAERFASRADGHGDGLPYLECLEFEKEALTRLYEMTTRAVWNRIVEEVAEAETVAVVGQVTLEGIAAVLTSRLHYLRPDVRHVTGHDGMFLDIFDRPDRRNCLILLDDRRYAKSTTRLLKLARESNVKVVLITDEYCLWAQEHTDLWLSLPTKGPAFWPTLSTFGSFVSLLLNAVMAHVEHRNEGGIADRMKQIGKLQERFDLFEG